MSGPVEILQFLQESLPLFTESQSYITQYDELSGEREVPLGPINEARNAFFHLYKCVRDQEVEGKVEENILLARDHLRRSCFDAYLALCGFLIKEIEDLENQYSVVQIKEGYPQYYDLIKLDIAKIKSENTQMRTLKEQRSTAFDKRKKADGRKSNIQMLHAHFLSIPDIVSCIEAEKKRQQKEELKRREEQRVARTHSKNMVLLTRLLAVLGGVFLLYLGYKYFSS